MATDHQPRITPGTPSQIGRRNAAITRAIGAATGTGRPNLFATLARHRSLFGAWMRFAGALMPRGKLPRADTELLILRTAHNSDNEYEWRFHERIAQTVGLTREDVERVRRDDARDAAGWSERQRLLLRACDELHGDRVLSDELVAQLRPLVTDVELIELCMLVGHYEMLAMTVASLRIAPDEFAQAGPTRAMSLLGRLGR